MVFEGWKHLDLSLAMLVLVVGMLSLLLVMGLWYPASVKADSAGVRARLSPDTPRYRTVLLSSIKLSRSSCFTWVIRLVIRCSHDQP